MERESLKITEVERTLLYAEHYGYFDFVYNELKTKGTVETDEYLENSRQRIETIVGPVCTELEFGGNEYGRKILQK